MSNKRMRRDSMGAAAYGIASNNPIPLAIPILCERALPPDRLSRRPSTSSSPSSQSYGQDDVGSGSQESEDALPKLKLKSSQQQLQVSSLIELGRRCAKLMSATCVSEQLSKSYKEQSLRFTCQNGHNFFLSVRKVQETDQLLNSRKLSQLSETEILKLSWCNKCTKFYARVKSLSLKLKLNFLGGLFQKRILLNCQKSNHHFSITYSKKLEQINCLKCRLDEKELHKDQLRRE